MPEQSEVTIRRAGADDIETLVKLRLALLDETGFLPPEERVPELADAIRRYFRESLLSEEFLGWVAQAPEGIVATSGLVFLTKPPLGDHLSGAEAYVMNMYTVPAWRGRGLATELLRQVVAFVRGTGVRRISLHASAAGRPVYLRSGFVEVGSEMRMDWSGGLDDAAAALPQAQAAQETQAAQEADGVNKALIRRYYEDLWNRWIVDLATELIAPEVSFRGSLGVSVCGREGFLHYMAMVRDAFPDFHNTVEQLIAEGDTVVARLTYRGTHRGDLFGISPTGREVSYSGTAIFRIADGRITEGWVLGDTAHLARQLGRELW